MAIAEGYSERVLSRKNRFRLIQVARELIQTRRISQRWAGFLTTKMHHATGQYATGWPFRRSCDCPAYGRKQTFSALPCDILDSVMSREETLEIRPFRKSHPPLERGRNTADA